MVTEPKPHTQALNDAQAELNRAVSRWTRQEPGDAANQALTLAWSSYQTAVQAGFMATVNLDGNESPAPKPPAGWAINTTTTRNPLAETARFPYDVATEARIANLLAVVNYPHPIPSGDLVRKAAVARALAMLGLDTVPTT